MEELLLQLLYIWAMPLLWAPWVVAIGDFVLGNSTPIARRWARLLSLEAQDSDRSACQSSRGQAASSGIAVLSPALFTLVTLQHLELTPGMSYRQCSSQGKWPVRLSEETNTLFTLPFISINSVCVYSSMPIGEGAAWVNLQSAKCVCVSVCRPKYMTKHVGNYARINMLL